MHNGSFGDGVYLPRVNPDVAAVQPAPHLLAHDARQLAADLGATLVEYFQHAEGWCAFVVTSDNVQHVPLPLVNEDLSTKVRAWESRIEKSDAGRGKLSYSPQYRVYDAAIMPLVDYLLKDKPVVLSRLVPCI